MSDGEVSKAKLPQGINIVIKDKFYDNKYSLRSIAPLDEAREFATERPRDDDFCNMVEDKQANLLTLLKH